MLRTMLQCWICSYNIRNVFQYQKLGTSLDVGQLIEKNKKHFKLRARDSISHSVCRLVGLLVSRSVSPLLNARSTRLMAIGLV